MIILWKSFPYSAIFGVNWLKRLLVFDVSRLVSTEAHLCCLSLPLKQPLRFYLPAGSYDWSESGFGRAIVKLAGSGNSVLFRLFWMKSLQFILLNISCVNSTGGNDTKKAITFYLNNMQIIKRLSFSRMHRRNTNVLLFLCKCLSHWK